MIKKILISGLAVFGISSVAYSDVKIGNPMARTGPIPELVKPMSAAVDLAVEGSGPGAVFHSTAGGIGVLVAAGGRGGDFGAKAAAVGHELRKEGGILKIAQDAVGEIVGAFEFTAHAGPAAPVVFGELSDLKEGQD